MVELTCAAEGCERVFKRKLGEVKRSQARGRSHYCSRACSAREGNKTRTRIAGIWPGARGEWRDELSPFRSYMRSVRLRDPETDVDVEYLRALWDEQGGTCPLTGWALRLPETSRGQGEARPDTASIDRIDSTVGYVRGNLRWTSYMANCARNRFTDADVREFARAVALQ